LIQFQLILLLNQEMLFFYENRFNSILRQLQPQQLVHSSNENEISLEQVDNNDESC